MIEPVAYLATNPTYPIVSNQIVREPQDWHITWEFKPLYLHPDPRVAELEAVLVELMRVAPREVKCNNMHHAKKDQHGYDETCPVVSRYAEAIAKIDKILCRNNT